MEIRLDVDAGPGGDDEERAELTLRLRDELELADVESVTPLTHTEQPAGAKSGDALSWSTFVVTLASSRALTPLIGMVNSWLGRQKRGSITLKIGDDELVLTSAAPEEQRRLVEAWLERHGGRVVSDG